MKEAVTKVIDTLTQEDFHGVFQQFLERFKNCIAAGGDYSEGELSFMCVLSTKVPILKKSGNYRMLLVKVSKVGDRSRGQSEGSLFNSFYIEMLGRVLLFFWIAPLTLDPYLIILTVEQGGIKHHIFEFLEWLDLGSNSTNEANMFVHMFVRVCIY